MTKKPLFHHVLMLGIAVVGEGLDGDTTAGIKQTDDLQVFGIHQLDQILHDDVDTVLVEVAMVAEAEEIQLQTLALHHQPSRDVVDDQVAEIGLACLGAQGGELGTIQCHQVFVLRMFVFKRLQHLRGIVVVVLRVLVAQQRDAFQFLFVSRHIEEFARKITKMFATKAKKLPFAIRTKQISIFADVNNK